MKNVRAKCAKIMFFSVKGANLWGFSSVVIVVALISPIEVAFKVVR